MLKVQDWLKVFGLFISQLATNKVIGRSFDFKLLQNIAYIINTWLTEF